MRLVTVSSQTLRTSWQLQNRPYPLLSKRNLSLPNSKFTGKCRTIVPVWSKLQKSKFYSQISLLIPRWQSVTAVIKQYLMLVSAFLNPNYSERHLSILCREILYRLESGLEMRSASVITLKLWCQLCRCKIFLMHPLWHLKESRNRLTELKLAWFMRLYRRSCQVVLLFYHIIFRSMWQVVEADPGLQMLKETRVMTQVCKQSSLLLLKASTSTSNTGRKMRTAGVHFLQSVWF